MSIGSDDDSEIAPANGDNEMHSTEIQSDAEDIHSDLSKDGSRPTVRAVYFFTWSCPTTVDRRSPSGFTREEVAQMTEQAYATLAPVCCVSSMSSVFVRIYGPSFRCELRLRIRGPPLRLNRGDTFSTVLYGSVFLFQGQLRVFCPPRLKSNPLSSCAHI